MQKQLFILRFCLCQLGFLLIGLQAIAQTPDVVSIRGVVRTAEKAEPLPGVSIALKGSTRGTSTDASGSYQLSIPRTATNSGVLVFSYIGFLSKEVKLQLSNQQTSEVIDVTLTADIQSLGEVVIIGYGEQSRKTVSTAISKVEGRTLALQPVSTPGEALAALAPGVQVQAGRGGTPGAPPIIRIRGVGSLGTNSNPLYVVDGYPLQDPGQFTIINPIDIESIDILKDAASAAIYGSRAANGVVIVTTKRGKTGKPRFNFSAYTGFQKIAKKMDLLNRDEYIANAKYTARLRGLAYPAIFDTDPGSLPDTDWQDAIFRTAPIQSYQLSATGGSESVRYAVSGAYFNQVGTAKGTSFDRYNLRFNLDADLSSKLRIGVSLAPSYSQQFVQPAGGQFNSAASGEVDGTRSLPSPLHSALLMPPVLPVYNKDGDYAQYFDGPTNPNGGSFFQTNLFNPLAVLELNINRIRNYRLLGNTFLEWEPIANLRLKSSVGSTIGLDDQYAYIPATLTNERAPQANQANPVMSQIFSREAQRFSVDWLWENTATYTRRIGNDHNFNLLALYSLQKSQAKGTATSGRNGTFTNPLLENPLASPDLVGELSYNLNAFLSYGGRLTYDFRSKYIFSAAIRRDASSRFGPNNRFATFPSISAAWRLSEEPFMDKLKNVVSDLKIRASYGQTGNANINDFTWANGLNGRNYSFGGQRLFGYEQSGFPNYDLTWEKNEQTDLGLEADLFNNKLSIGLDWYNRFTEGMLFQKDLPGIIGYGTSFRTNLGKLRNRGIELFAKTNLRIGAVRWTIDGNISANRTKVLNLGGQASLPAQGAVSWPNIFRISVGEPLGDMYGYEVAGVFKNADDLANYPQYVTGDKVGNWIIKDQNGDGKADEKDQVVIGKGFPDFIYGMTHSVQFNNFDLNLIVQGVQGIDIINGNLRHLWGPPGFNTHRVYYQNMFDPQEPTRDVYFPAQAASGVTLQNFLTDRVLSNGSFVRLRNVTVGYTIPSPALKRLRLQSLRVYATGQNLLTLTNYIGYNPEASLNGDSVFAPGIDIGTYPANRTYTVGINFGF